jgi:hypothetical protein
MRKEVLTVICSDNHEPEHFAHNNQSANKRNKQAFVENSEIPARETVQSLLSGTLIVIHCYIAALLLTAPFSFLCQLRYHFTSLPGKLIQLQVFLVFVIL